jgi:hypothetical protein
MKTYAFCIRCPFAGGHFETKERDILLALPALARPVNVFVPERQNQTDNLFLTLWCGGFSSEAEARAGGAPVKTALMLAGVLLGVGIDVGDDQVVSPRPLVDGQPDERLQSEVHGLQVVPEIEGMHFWSLPLGRPVRRISPGDFEKKVAEGYGLGKPLTKKQTLAAQLYNQSHFLSSEAARFITLISAVEVLAEQSRSSPAAVALVQKLIDMAVAAVDVEASEKQALEKHLGYLKRESIGSACRALVRTHFEEPAVKDFTRLYKTRSELLHNGEPASGTDLAVELRELDLFVRRLVLRQVAAS